MAAGSVTYDSIINVQTLSWTFYDVVSNFDLAPHLDLDVHISLLYGIDDKPSDYTGIRTAYPVDRQQRIGVLNPPDANDDRKYIEKTIASDVAESSHEYIGNITQSPTNSPVGIRQSLQLKNKTAVRELSLIDTPLAGTISKTFDANEWHDLIAPLVLRTRSTESVPHPDGAENISYLPIHREIVQTSGEMLVDMAERTVSIDCKIVYDPDLIVVVDLDVALHNLPERADYTVAGLTDEQLSTGHLNINVTSQIPAGTDIWNLHRRGSCTVHMLVAQSSATTLPIKDPSRRTIRLDFGFGSWNYMRDPIDEILNSYGTSATHATLSVFGNTTKTYSLLSLPVDIIVDRPVYHWVTSDYRGVPRLQTMGYVDSAKFEDDTTTIYLHHTYISYTDGVVVCAPSQHVDNDLLTAVDPVALHRLPSYYYGSGKSHGTIPYVESW